MNSYLKIKTINYYYFLKDFIYLSERVREKAKAGREAEGEGERIPSRLPAECGA